jgi:glycosyltransferase involved in cell wall biosynthesis
MSLKLSVIVPVLTKSDFIDDLFGSLFNQQGIKRSELEVIVIDGGPESRTGKVIKRYSGQLAFWESEPSGNQVSALAKGFKLATGDIFTWLSPGNLLESWTVREVLDFFKSRPDVQFVYGNARLIDNEGNILKIRREIPFSWYIWLYDHNYIPQPAAFWRRQIYEEIGGIKEIPGVSVDDYLWANFAQHTHLYHVNKLWAKMHEETKNRNHFFEVKSSLEGRRVGEQPGPPILNKTTLLVNTLLARSLRVGWKLVSGCYWK